MLRRNVHVYYIRGGGVRIRITMKYEVTDKPHISDIVPCSRHTAREIKPCIVQLEVIPSKRDS